MKNNISKKISLLNHTQKWFLISIATIAFSLISSFQSTFAQTPDEASKVLPAKFVAHRIYVQPVTNSGDTLTLYTDTGGGLVITKSAVKRLGLPIVDTVTFRGKSRGLTKLPDFQPSSSIPPVPRGILYVLPVRGI